MKRKRLLIIAAALVALSAAAVCDSKYRLQLSEYTLAFENLPPELDGLRIVHLSDLHGSRFGRENSRLSAAVLALEPDIIAMTGDMASSRSELPAFEELVSGLSGAAQIYYVPGNHEWASGIVPEVETMLARYGARCLRNEYEALYASGAEARIVVCGADDPNGRADMLWPDALAAELRRDYPDEFVLWLAHRNSYAELYPDLPADLILCGHAHGGIVRLPLVGGLLRHSLGAEHNSGVYYCNSYVMEVSRGLGNSLIIPRLFNRPEIVCITLKSC